MLIDDDRADPKVFAGNHLSGADSGRLDDAPSIDIGKRALLRAGVVGAIVAATSTAVLPNSAKAAACTSSVPVYETHAEGICPNDSGAAAALEALLDAAPQGAVIFFTPGDYDLSLWTGYILQKSITFWAHPGTVTLTGPGKIDQAAKRFLNIDASTGSDKVRVTIEGLSFSDFGATLFSSPTNPIEELTIRSCRFDNVVFALNTYVAAGDFDGKIRLLRVEDCEISNTSKQALLLRCLFDRALILRNRISDLDETAISLGSTGNGFASLEDHWKKAIISHNVLTNIVTSSTGDIHGIIVGGREAIISHNHIENVQHSGTSTGDEGIYLKARYCDVSHNTLFDAGTNEAAITIKGASREDPAPSTPGGYANRICNNSIMSSASVPTGNGIKVFRSDTLIANNYFENLDVAIELAGSNQLVTGNLVRRCHGGVAYSGSGSRISISNNLIELLEKSGGHGITMTLFSAPASGDPIPSDWSIEGNTIHGDLTSTLSNRSGILIWCGNAGNSSNDKTLEGVTIANNRLSDLVTGIWSKSTSFPTLSTNAVWIKGNLFRNLDTDIHSALESETTNVIIEHNLSS